LSPNIHRKNMLPAMWRRLAWKNIDDNTANNTCLPGKYGLVVGGPTGSPPQSATSAADNGSRCVTSHGTIACE
jgi:hypothetical protein